MQHSMPCFDEREQSLSLIRPDFICFAAFGICSGLLSPTQHHCLPTEQGGSRALMAGGEELIECVAAVLHCAPSSAHTTMALQENRSKQGVDVFPS